MRQHEPVLGGLVSPTELIKRCGLHRPLDLIQHLPEEPFAMSDGLPWVGLEALRYRDQPPNEAFQPPLTHHRSSSSFRRRGSSRRSTKGSAGSSHPGPARS